MSRDGQLTAAGRPVLGARGPISVRSAEVAITEQGEVIEGGQTVDTLRIVDFPAPYRLVKEGANLFAPASASVRPLAVSDARVVPGALEDSNVSAVESVVTMIETLRLYEATQRAVQALDEAGRQAMRDIGSLT